MLTVFIWIVFCRLDKQVRKQRACSSRWFQHGNTKSRWPSDGSWPIIDMNRVSENMRKFLFKHWRVSTANRGHFFFFERKALNWWLIVRKKISGDVKLIPNQRLITWHTKRKYKSRWVSGNWFFFFLLFRIPSRLPLRHSRVHNSVRVTKKKKIA